MTKTKILYILAVIFFVAIQAFNGILAQNLTNKVETDTSKVKFSLNKFLNFNDSVFSFNFQTLANSALNYKRFTLISNHKENHGQFAVNSGMQLYYDEFIPNGVYSGINNQFDAILGSLQHNKSNNTNEELLEYINTLNKKEILYSLWRANLVNVKDEIGMGENIVKTTTEMMGLGYDNLSEDLLPFITMLMYELKKHHYQTNRVVSTKPEAKGIVTAIQMLNTLSTLDDNIEAGVCRDVHDLGLRILRPMYDVYLDEKYPGNNYNVDDYIFLQAWVTPSSQHVTLVVLDPENTRNYHELDWAKVYKKENQEGIEIGKMVGTTIRLWQYNPEKDVTGAFNILKSQWGIFLDNNVLKPDENWIINGIYNPLYASSANYLFSSGKNSETGLSLAMLNANEKSLTFSYRSGKHYAKLTKYFQYSGVVGFQAMVIDDTQRKSFTMATADWGSAVNFLNTARYISTIKTSPLKITSNFKANMFALSQIELGWSMSYFKSSDIDFNNKLKATGDGNIWLSWGAEFNYNKPKIEFDLKFGSRNFLIPTDIRLLSPNPFELIKHATIANSSIDILFRAKLTAPTWYFEPEFRYEQNKMDAKFAFYSLKVSKTIKKENYLFIQAGSFNQIQGIEYYWYPKDRFWANTGYQSSNKKFSISIYSEKIQNDFLTFGLNFSKLLN